MSADPSKPALTDAWPTRRDLAAAQGRCGSVSRQGEGCQLPNGHGQACHEARVDNGVRRWWEEDRAA